MLEILNSNEYSPPIIVFVNQKKTADMVAKDLSRAGVRSPSLSSIYAVLIHLVEHRHIAFGQEPRTARSITPVTA